MERKYFFFDIDGTLVPGSGMNEVPADTRAALAQLEANGHFLAIATGRAHCLSVGQMKSLGFHNMVSDGGYGVTINDELLGIEPLNREACIALADECDAKCIPWGCGIEDDPVRITNSQRFCELTDGHYQVARVVPDFDIHEQPRILRMFVALDHDIEETLPSIRRLPWMMYEGMHYVYVEPQSKGRGIRRIMERFGARDEDVVVFGDSKNDLSMFLPEWTCIAMGNATPELKAQADYVTLDADKDGIGHALRHFGWI